tara:strand:- start:113 stop:682 length:570 start_codon:yes stop_codon:yes gene_type:complete
VRIAVKYNNVDPLVFEPLVKQCYKEGKDAGLLRGGEASSWSLPLRDVLYDKVGLEASSSWFSEILSSLKITQVALSGLGAIPLAGSLLMKHPSSLNVAYFRGYKKDYGSTSTFEGRVDTEKSILIVDDLLNSGYACTQLVKDLQEIGIKTKYITVAVLAQFMFGQGEQLLRQRGITNIQKAMEVYEKDE